MNFIIDTVIDYEDRCYQAMEDGEMQTAHEYKAYLSGMLDALMVKGISSEEYRVTRDAWNRVTNAIY